MAAKKQKANLFSGGLLATTTEQPSDEQSSINRAGMPTTEEEDDPLFGDTKRIRDITMKVGAVTDISAYPRIALELLDDKPYQPRRRVNEKRLDALAHEIRVYGFKGVVLARAHPEASQRYQLVYGHRRREAARRAGLTELPVLVDTITDAEMKFLAINENVLRDDLTPLDEAYAYASMLEEMSQEAVAERLGVSRGYIRNRIDILKAPEDVQDMVEEKPDTMKAVVYLKDVQEDDIRQTAIQALKNEEITINQLKAFIENLRKQKQTTILAPREEQPASPGSQQDVPLTHEGHLPTTQNAPASPAQQKRPSDEIVRPSPGEKPAASLIQQSREQTEAATDRTKIEAFTRYLEKYSDHLKSRQMTTEEKASLDTLIMTARRILSTHASQQVEG